MRSGTNSIVLFVVEYRRLQSTVDRPRVLLFIPGLFRLFNGLIDKNRDTGMRAWFPLITRVSLCPERYLAQIVIAFSGLNDTWFLLAKGTGG